MLPAKLSAADSNEIPPTRRDTAVTSLNCGHVITLLRVRTFRGAQRTNFQTQLMKSTPVQEVAGWILAIHVDGLRNI